MLWTYDEPAGQRGALDGDTYWFIDPVDRQVRTHRRDPDAPDPLAELLAGRLQLGRVFAVRRGAGQPARGRALLELLPREPRGDMDRAILEVEERDGTVRAVDIVDPMGNRFGYRLGPPVAAPAPPASAFRLVIPPGFVETAD